MRRGSVHGLNFGRRRKKINVPLLKEIGTWVIEIAIVLVISFVFVYFIGLRTTVVGQSMNPTIENGEEILVNRFVYKLKKPKANDVIVFLPNGNEKSHYYVKRVIGVPIVLSNHFISFFHSSVLPLILQQLPIRLTILHFFVNCHFYSNYVSVFVYII